jgi:starch synthase
MDKLRVLIISQEMDPFTELSAISHFATKLPQYLNEQGVELRLLMPKFGTINERRHRLHEVVRLSGMNIIVNDDDYPLIIKVTSLPTTRLQVYFLDNDEFFKRKTIFKDEEGVSYEDNIDRMVFFCKGAIETVKKFGWSPDIIHCHGWMTSLIPMYLKTAYKNDPLFNQSKVVYSIYDDFTDKFDITDFNNKSSINNLNPEDMVSYESNGLINPHKGAINFSDAVINGSEDMNPDVTKLVEDSKKPALGFIGLEDDFAAGYYEFYQSMLTEDVPN